MGDSKADHSPAIIRTRVVLKINTIDLNRVDTHSVCLSNGNANNGYTIDVVPYCLQQPIALLSYQPYSLSRRDFSTSDLLAEIFVLLQSLKSTKISLIFE